MSAKQMSPLRYAPVDMTVYRHSSCLPNLFSDFFAMTDMMPVSIAEATKK
jgi:hypothetical protein